MMKAPDMNDILRDQGEDALRQEFDTAPRVNGKGSHEDFIWPDLDLSLIDDRRGDLPDFPLDVLSEPCRDWVDRAAHGAGVTIGHVAVPLLGIVSSLIGTTRRVMASTSWTQPMTIWVAIVGFSGTGKTPGLDCTKRALSQVDRQRKTKINDKMRAHEARVEAAKAERARWKEMIKEKVVQLDEVRASAHKLKQTEPMPREAMDPGPFIAERLFVSNSTIEKLADLLQARPQGMLLLSDELSALFLNMSRYSGGQDNEFWLEAWNGGPYRLERMSRNVDINHLLVGVVGGLQPDKLARSFKGDFDGMYARICFAWPEEPAYAKLTDEVAEVEPAILNALNRIVNLEGGKDQDGGFAPKAIKLSTEARSEFEAFRQSVHVEKFALDGRDREWWAKAPAHVLRLTGTLCYLSWAMAGGDEPEQIDVEFMRAAIRLVRDYFWPHSRASLRQIGLSDQHATKRRALRWLQANGRAEVSREEIRRDALSQSLDAKQTDELLEALARGGWVRKVSTPSSKKAGRPVHRWLVNPALLSLAEITETYTRGGDCR